MTHFLVVIIFLQSIHLRCLILPVQFGPLFMNVLTKNTLLLRKYLYSILSSSTPIFCATFFLIFCCYYSQDAPFFHSSRNPVLKFNTVLKNFKSLQKVSKKKKVVKKFALTLKLLFFFNKSNILTIHFLVDKYCFWNKNKAIEILTAFGKFIHIIWFMYCNSFPSFLNSFYSFPLKSLEAA